MKISCMCTFNIIRKGSGLRKEISKMGAQTAQWTEKTGADPDLLRLHCHMSTNGVPWRLRHPPVGHCDTPTRTIRHCKNSPQVMLRRCDTTSAIWLDSGFFVQGVFMGA